MATMREKLREVREKSTFFDFHKPSAKFRKKHGPECIREGNEILYRDGAVLEVCDMNHPRCVPPPADKWERAKKVVRYYEIKASRARYEFDFCKATMFGTAVGQQYQFPDSVDGYDEEQVLEHLNKLATDYETLRRNLRRARKRVLRHQPAKSFISDDIDIQEKARLSLFRQRVDAIKRRA